MAPTSTREVARRRGWVAYVPNTATAVTVACSFSVLIPTTPTNVCVACTFIGLFTDAIDGALARVLGVSSKVGANFDQLADLCCFGVAPAAFFARQQLRGYEPPMDAADVLPYVAGCVYMVCAAYRIARELVVHAGKKPTYFVGIPSNVAAVPAALTAAYAPLGELWPSLLVVCLGAAMVSPFHIPAIRPGDFGAKPRAGARTRAS